MAAIIIPNSSVEDLTRHFIDGCRGVAHMGKLLGFVPSRGVVSFDPESSEITTFELVSRGGGYKVSEWLRDHRHRIFKLHASPCGTMLVISHRAPNSSDVPKVMVVGRGSVEPEMFNDTTGEMRLTTVQGEVRTICVKTNYKAFKDNLAKPTAVPPAIPSEIPSA